MRKTDSGGKTASTIAFSSRAESRSRPNGFSITTRRHGAGPPEAGAGPGSDSPDRLSCSTTVGKNFGGIDR